MLAWSSAAHTEELSGPGVCGLRDRDGQMRGRRACWFTMKRAVQTSYCRARNVSGLHLSGGDLIEMLSLPAFLILSQKRNSNNKNMVQVKIC